MTIWLDPTGKSTFGMGVCARCWRKMSLDDLFSDPNSPGLKVCRNDIDEYDPYRLPARKTEDIALRFNRPDEKLTAGGPSPNVNSLFSVRSVSFAIRGTVDGNRRQFLPPLPTDVTG